MNSKYIYENWELLLDSELQLNGWIKTIRSSKEFGFIEINDGFYFKNIQVVFDTSLSNFEELSKLSIYSSIKVSGKLVKSQGNQDFEIYATNIEIIQISESDFPLQKKRHTFEYLRTIAHLRPRTNTFGAVFRVRSLLAYAIHKYFNENDFVYVNTPIITGSDCEGAGEMFRVTTLDLNNIPKDSNGKVDDSKDFFGKETNLTVSGQLSAENYCMTFNKVYTFGPTFRAENSNTTRHAAEFWMLEPEIAFSDINDNMNLAESMLKYVFQYILDKAPLEMEFFDKWIEKGVKQRLIDIVNAEFGKITYTEAIEILTNSGKEFEYPVKWGIDLQTEHERYLTDELFKKPVFVINYPRDIKAFYMKQNEDGRTVAAMDLLVPGIGELIGGSQREEDYTKLHNRIKDMGLNVDDYSWYLDLRRFGSVPHAGFGLGFERLIMYVTGMGNIRDVIPFPRTPKNAEF
ncbi:MAG: asparagine--tRNA ligase [Candidatus Absconditabacteria bacterium]